MDKYKYRNKDHTHEDRKKSIKDFPSLSCEFHKLCFYPQCKCYEKEEGVNNVNRN